MANKVPTVPVIKPEATNIEQPDNKGTAAEKKVEHAADRAAHKAAKDEQRYDEEHSIFSN